MRILLEVLRVDLALYFRNWVAVFWTVAFPFLLLIVLMAAFGESRGQLGSMLVVVQDKDQSAQSRTYRKTLEEALTHIDAIAFRVVDAPGYGSNENNTLRIAIPSGFGASLETHQPAEVSAVVRAENVYLTRAAAAIVAAVNDRVNIESGRSSELVSLSLKELSPTRKFLSFAQFLVTGIIVMATFSTCLFGFTQPIVSYRENGYLKVLGVLPISALPFFTSFVTSRVVITVAYAVFFFICARLLYNVEFVQTISTWLSFAVLFGAGVVTFLAIGFAVAAISPTQNAASVFCNLLYFSLTFLGNLFFPMRNLPGSFETAVSLSPLNSLVGGLRAVLFEGAALSSQGRVLLLLGGWIVVALLLAFGVRRVRSPLRLASRKLEALSRRPK